MCGNIFMLRSMVPKNSGIQFFFSRLSLPRIILCPEYYRASRHLVSEKYIASKITLHYVKVLDLVIRYKKSMGPLMGPLLEEYHYYMIFLLYTYNS